MLAKWTIWVNPSNTTTKRHMTRQLCTVRSMYCSYITMIDYSKTFDYTVRFIGIDSAPITQRHLFLVVASDSDLVITKSANVSLLWRHNGCDGVSSHQPQDCLLNRLFRHRSKKTPKLRVAGFCAGKSPKTGEFPAQMTSACRNAIALRVDSKLHEYLNMWPAIIVFE